MNISLSIPEKIFHLRGVAVLLDSDLAGWYGIETRVLKQTVRRNMDRFPADFMFELSLKEQAALRSQNVTLNKRGQHPKYRAFAFTQEGVAMLSGLLRSPLAVIVNVHIMRTFVALRQQAQHYQELAQALQELELRSDQRFAEIDELLDALLEHKQQQDDFNTRKRIGYK